MAFSFSQKRVGHIRFCTLTYRKLLKSKPSVCSQSQVTHGGRSGGSDGCQGGKAFSVRHPDLLPRGRQQHGGRPLQPRSWHRPQRQGAGKNEEDAQNHKIRWGSASCWQQMGPSALLSHLTVSLSTEKPTHSQEPVTDAYPRPQLPPGGFMTLSPTDEAPDTWHPFTARAGESTGLPSIAYSLSPEGLSLTGQQYATSLLNLLHNEQADMGPSLASSSKPELHHSWMVQPGLREPVDPAMVFKPGKKQAEGKNPRIPLSLCFYILIK